MVFGARLGSGCCGCWSLTHWVLLFADGECRDAGAAIGDGASEEALEEVARRVGGLLAGVQKEGESASVWGWAGSGEVDGGPSP